MSDIPTFQPTVEGPGLFEKYDDYLQNPLSIVMVTQTQPEQLFSKLNVDHLAEFFNEKLVEKIANPWMTSIRSGSKVARFAAYVFLGIGAYLHDAIFAPNREEAREMVSKPARQEIEELKTTTRMGCLRVESNIYKLLGKDPKNDLEIRINTAFETLLDNRSQGNLEHLKSEVDAVHKELTDMIVENEGKFGQGILEEMVEQLSVDINRKVFVQESSQDKDLKTQAGDLQGVARQRKLQEDIIPKFYEEVLEAFGGDQVKALQLLGFLQQGSASLYNKEIEKALLEQTGLSEKNYNVASDGDSDYSFKTRVDLEHKTMQVEYDAKIYVGNQPQNGVDVAKVHCVIDINFEKNSFSIRHDVEILNSDYKNQLEQSLT